MSLAAMNKFVYFFSIANGLKCHQTILVSESAEPADADSCETANGFCYKIRQGESERITELGHC